uniref:Serine/threonine-protein kinase 11-interacting protein n=3 Tax=Lygus hesperus TaxID=30085 RepID=A0A146M7T5_LYGHE
MNDDAVLKELMKIVDLAVVPIAADDLMRGSVELALKPPLLEALNNIFNIQTDASFNFADKLFSYGVPKKLDRFLHIVNRVPTVHLRQRSYYSYDNSIDLAVFHNLKSLVLEQINLQKLKWKSHLKSQLVSFSGSFCSGIEAVFCDKLAWAELVDLSLTYCKLEPCNNDIYFLNAPWIRILNLSYCNLKSCEFLVNLHFLEHLNLSFNFLSNIPTLSDLCEIKTLKMDNNCVEHLSGIEKLRSLKYLDLSFNWLPNKYSLMPLEKAENLVTISLAGCPVSFIKHYRIYVAMCICTKTLPHEVKIDGVALNKTEQSTLGLNLLKKDKILFVEEQSLHSTNVLVGDINVPSTSTYISEEQSASSYTPGKPKPRPKKSILRVPVIHDESSPSPKEAESPLPEVEISDDVPRAPTVVPKGPIASVNFTLTQELRAIQEAILRAPTSQAGRMPQENGMQTTIIKPKLHLGGITIPSFINFDDDSPLPEIVPETVFALVHATESEHSQDCSNKEVEPRTKNEDELENDRSTAGLNSSRSHVTFADQGAPEENPSYDGTEELSKKLEDELFTALDYGNSQGGLRRVRVELVTEYPAQRGSESILDDQIAVPQHDCKTWEHNSDSGAGSDMKTSSESYGKHGSDNQGQQCVDTEVSAEDLYIPNSGELGGSESPIKEIDRVGEVTIDEKHSDKSDSSPKDSDEESCYESDPDADEFLWHVMRVDPTTKSNQPIFLALLENELKERSPKSGETLTKWPLELVVSCVKTKNLPITIEMEFDTVKKDKQHREYIMEYADAQALTKKIYNILESRPLSAMNEASHSCLKCSTIFVYKRPSKFGVTESAPSCPVCGSTVVEEVEEPKMPEKNDSVSKPLSHSPSQSSIVIGHGAETPGSSQASSTAKDSRICSARSMEQGLRPEALTNPRKYESDIEVISNPSQSSIEVIDESSRSQSVTPMRKKSDDRQTAFTTEQSIREMLSPLSALTESSSSGSLTESVITAYESSSVIINKKSVECLPEASCENSPSENVMSIATKGITEEENGNEASPKSPKDVYSFTDLDMELRLKTYIYHDVFTSENEELCSLVRCHIWKTGGSDYDGCFVLSTTAVYFLFTTTANFSDQSNWFSLNESYRIADLRRVQPIIWYQGLEIQIKNFSFILLLMDGDRTQNLIKDFNGLTFKGVKVVAKPNPKVELSLQQSVLTNDLNHNSEDPSVIHMVLCRSLEISKVEVDEEEYLRLAGLVLTCGLFIVIPGDLSWLCSGAQPSIVASRDLSSLIEVEKKDMQLVFHFLDEAEAVEELWSVKFGVSSQIDSLLDAIRRPWERRFSVPLEITGL